MTDRQLYLAEAGVRAARIALAVAEARQASAGKEGSGAEQLAAALAIAEAKALLKEEQAKLDALRTQRATALPTSAPAGGPSIITRTQAAQLTSAKTSSPILP